MSNYRHEPASPGPRPTLKLDSVASLPNQQDRPQTPERKTSWAWGEAEQHECDRCMPPKTFSSESDMIKHLIHEHKGSYWCRDCKEFRPAYTYPDHLSRFHTKEPRVRPHHGAFNIKRSSILEQRDVQEVFQRVDAREDFALRRQVYHIIMEENIEDAVDEIINMIRAGPEGGSIVTSQTARKPLEFNSITPSSMVGFSASGRKPAPPPSKTPKRRELRFDPPEDDEQHRPSERPPIVHILQPLEDQQRLLEERVLQNLKEQRPPEQHPERQHEILDLVNAYNMDVPSDDDDLHQDPGNEQALFSANIMRMTRNAIDKIREANEKQHAPMNEATSTSSPATKSISESPEPSEVQETEIDVLPAFLSDGLLQGVSECLLNFFTKWIDLQVGLLKSRGSGNSSRNGPSQNTALQRSSLLGPGKGSGRRKRSDGDGEEELPSERPGGGRGGDGPERKRRKANKQKIEKFACPYMKRYPATFATWRTCVGPGFDELHRMKEHLKRRHFKEHSCARCGDQFDSNHALLDHMRARTICSIRDFEPACGFMTQLQFEDVQKIKTGDPVRKWKEIFRVLFPDADETLIPSPYFDSAEVSESLSEVIDPTRFESYLKQHLPNRILSRLNEEFKMLAEEAKRRLTQIVQEETMETFKGYMMDKGGDSSSSTDVPPEPTLEPNFWDWSIFENMDMTSFNNIIHTRGEDLLIDPYNLHVDKGKGLADSGYGSMAG